MSISTVIRNTTVLLLLGASSLAFSAKNGEKSGAWEYACQGNECVLSQVVKDGQGDLGMAFVIKAKNGKQSVYVLNMIFPLGVTIPMMASVSLDGTKLGDAPFAFCDQRGCNILPITLDPELLAKLKSGSNLKVKIHFGNKAKDANFSLKGFTKGVEGL